MTTAATIAAQLILDAKDYIAGIKGAGEATEKFSRDVDGRLRDVKGRFVGAGDAAQDFSTRLNFLGDNMMKVGGMMTAGLTLPIVAFAASAVNAAMESEAAIANLESTILSTGDKTGITSAEFQKMATELQNLTGYSDEAILDAQTMLLTFDEIGKESFPRATEATADLARRFGMDLHQASIMLGKALQDPAAGLGALSRVGVTFTEEQKAMVEQMMAVGDTAGAQAVIFAAVEAQVKGAAEAYGQTAAGQFDIFKQKLDGLKEAIGTALIPTLIRFMDALTPIIESLANNPAAVDFIVGLLGFVAASGPITTALGLIAKAIAFFSAGGGGAAAVAWVTGTLIPALGTIGTFISATLIPAIIPLLPVLALIAAAIFLVWLVWSNWDTLIVTIQQLWGIISGAFQIGMKVITDAVKNGIESMKAGWDGFKDKANGAIKDVQSASGQLGQDIGAKIAEGIGKAILKFNEMKAKVMIVVNAIKSAFSGAFNMILRTAQTAFNGIANAISRLIGYIQQLVSSLANIELPAVLTPGSPTPFEVGLRGIGDAMQSISQRSIPEMQVGLNRTVGDNQQGGGRSTYIDNRRFNGGMSKDELQTALDSKFSALAGAL